MNSLIAKCTGTLVLLAIGGTLPSCATSDDTLVNVISAPPPADFRTCGRLVDAIKASIKHQEQLEDLERKAGSGLDSAFAKAGYGPEHLKERANEINMRRSAREKGCQLPADMPPVDRTLPSKIRIVD